MNLKNDDILNAPDLALDIDEPESDEQQVEQPAEEAPQDTMPMQENVVTKKKLKKIAESISKRLK